MKKVTLLFIAVVAISFTIKAQENEIDFRDKIQIGLKIGANYSNVYDTKGEKFDASGKLGFAAGTFISIPVDKYIGIQPEVLFSQKGFQGNGVILGNAYNFTRTTSYLDIPIFISFKPSEFLTLLAGPQYSYLLNQKDVFVSSAYSSVQEKEFNNDNIRKNTLCFLFGGDINIKHIVISARAGWDILNNAGDGTSSTPRYKNVWYQGTVGYKF